MNWMPALSSSNILGMRSGTMPRFLYRVAVSCWIENVPTVIRTGSEASSSVFSAMRAQAQTGLEEVYGKGHPMAAESTNSIQPIATPRRRFTLVDAMILVAATAIGCAWMPWISQLTEGEVSWSNFFEKVDLFRSSDNASWTLSDVPILAVAGIYFAYLTAPLFMAWTLALIPIRVIGPRPRWRRLARQPGMMAACAAGLALVFQGLMIPLVMLIIPQRLWPNLLELLEAGMPLPLLFIGLAVSTSWMTLLVGRRWRAEASWVDRLGRALGVGWIALGFVVSGMVFVTMI
jgi:hypothetical protein